MIQGDCNFKNREYIKVKPEILRAFKKQCKLIELNRNLDMRKNVNTINNCKQNLGDNEFFEIVDYRELMVDLHRARVLFNEMKFELSKKCVVIKLVLPYTNIVVVARCMLVCKTWYKMLQPYLISLSFLEN